MWFEYIRYRFRLNADQNSLALAQIAALKSLRGSPRCRGWRVLPAPSDPSLSILEIEWDPGASLTPFRASEEFAELHAALTEQVRTLEESDYRADSRLLRSILGGPEVLSRLAEDIVVGIMREPELGARFQSEDGSRRGRLGLWLLEVLGGPELFSSSFPNAIASEGPLAGELLDLEDRALLLEIARDALPSSAEDQGRCVLGALRAHLPLDPPPPSRLGVDTRLLGEGDAASVRANSAPSRPRAPSNVEPASQQRALLTEVRHTPPPDAAVSSRLTPRTEPLHAGDPLPPHPDLLTYGGSQKLESGVRARTRIQKTNH
jgi:hypothetical protein